MLAGLKKKVIVKISHYFQAFKNSTIHKENASDDEYDQNISYICMKYSKNK